jgi:hypothetical protein
LASFIPEYFRERTTPCAPAENAAFTAWPLGGIAQSVAKPAYGFVDAPFGIDKCLTWPDFILQLIAGNHFTGARQQGSKHLEWLLLQLNSATASP